MQRFGGHLAGMVMPNIGAFIAWGLITALFIPTGWLPNETLNALGEPMIKFLLPILIGYTGGRLVHGQRGAVIGAIATVGVIAAAESPMFLGAMIIGPAAAAVLKGFDRLIDGKIKSGFEMLVNNFSTGIIGGAMAVLGLVTVGPLVDGLTSLAGKGVDFLVDNSLLPLVSVIVEPAKVLFLNNAINHGVLSPLAASESSSVGQSLLFMIESNPGPGLGILIAFFMFGPRVVRPSVPGAMIIHFLGGIHEIYFPYVLMKPRLILAAIGGGMAGVATAMITNSGLVASPSPGSIFAYIAVTPKGGHLSVLLSIVVATGVSFLLAAMLLRFGRGADELVDVPAVNAKTPAKAKVGASTAPSSGETRVVAGKDVKKLLVACDAGMGSSVMLASQMRTRLKPYGVTVEHVPVNDIPDDAQVVLTHTDLAERARASAPNAVVVPFNAFLGDPVFDEVEKAIKDGEEIRG
ncbi:PTS mannitol transporter subunit IICB [Amycolatopsis suaedae]|uniref:PTS mannitol transporter subunit IICB n=1 Tax=Amycolatopsis suaedae TaxID=2510978 RepID=UPI001F106314|nr:PTS mannitol transporter subunit IICBA [Amycolatopsis suaedae]